MKYDEALRAWGKSKLEEHTRHQPGPEQPIRVETVRAVIMGVEGYQCCIEPDVDPDCYCTLAQDPSYNFHIMGISEDGTYHQMKLGRIPLDALLRDICEASDAAITA